MVTVFMWEGENLLQLRQRCQHGKYQDNRVDMRPILPPSHRHTHTHTLSVTALRNWNIRQESENGEKKIKRIFAEIVKENCALSSLSLHIPNGFEEYTMRGLSWIESRVSQNWEDLRCQGLWEPMDVMWEAGGLRWRRLEVEGQLAWNDRGSRDGAMSLQGAGGDALPAESSLGIPQRTHEGKP